MRMHFPRFLMANAAGAALWVIAWVFIGYTFGHEIAKAKATKAERLKATLMEPTLAHARS